MVRTYICPLINTPHPPRGVIISQPIYRFLGVIFDGDHDFEGLRSPIAHLDTVLRNLLSHPRPPRTRAHHFPTGDLFLLAITCVCRLHWSARRGSWSRVLRWGVDFIPMKFLWRTEMPCARGRGLVWRGAG
eukprot:scaffold9347_cov64-Phaeocystis_antarctica.AAC.1